MGLITSKSQLCVKIHFDDASQGAECILPGHVEGIKSIFLEFEMRHFPL